MGEKRKTPLGLAANEEGFWSFDRPSGARKLVVSPATAKEPRTVTMENFGRGSRPTERGGEGVEENPRQVAPGESSTGHSFDRTESP
jgi:hypothetical protein